MNKRQIKGVCPVCQCSGIPVIRAPHCSDTGDYFQYQEGHDTLCHVLVTHNFYGVVCSGSGQEPEHLCS